MQYPCDPFTELHHLLALAGAEDLKNLNHWIRSHTLRGTTHRSKLVLNMAEALKAYVSEHYLAASRIIAKLIPEIDKVGGSGAQNQLFQQILISCQLN